VHRHAQRARIIGRRNRPRGMSGDLRTAVRQPLAVDMCGLRRTGRAQQQNAEESQRTQPGRLPPRELVRGLESETQASTWFDVSVQEKDAPRLLEHVVGAQPATSW